VTVSHPPSNVAVFFGEVDKRPAGWYWIASWMATTSVKGSFAGPFETKVAAVEDAQAANMAIATE
jgi:hypothetical protein